MQVEVKAEPNNYRVSLVFSDVERFEISRDADAIAASHADDLQERVRTDSESMADLRKRQRLLSAFRADLAKLEAAERELVRDRDRLLDEASEDGWQGPTAIEKKLDTTRRNIAMVKDGISTQEALVQKRIQDAIKEVEDIHRQVLNDLFDSKEQRRVEAEGDFLAKNREAAVQLLRDHLTAYRRGMALQRFSKARAVAIVQKLLAEPAAEAVSTA
jgi:hypothetical protein